MLMIPLYPRKNFVTSSIVSAGVVVGMLSMLLKSCGPVPTAQINLVPPASIPPYNALNVFTYYSFVVYKVKAVENTLITFTPV